MISAARSYLDNKPAPLELQLAMQHERWGVLPYTGGLLDQPAGLLDRMAWASAVHKAFRGRDTARDAIRWIDTHPEQYELYTFVKSMMKLVDRDGKTPAEAKRIVLERMGRHGN
jgi:hypothetical protein